MDTTVTLTPSEVIDRVQTARTFAHQCEVEQLHLAVQWALLHPCHDEFPAGWEDDHGLFTSGAPLAGVGAPLVDEFAPASFAAALGITRGHVDVLLHRARAALAVCMLEEETVC